MLFINAVMETKSKGQKPDADYLWDNATNYKLEYPQISDGDKKMRGLFSCSSLPMNVAVDLTSMKIVYSKCGYSASGMESFINSHFGY